MPYPIPTNLTVTRWNASKSLFDKVTQQHTGMATQLTEMARAAERVDMNVLTQVEERVSAAVSEEQLSAYETQLNKEINDLRALLQEANQTLTLVNKVATDIASKGSQQHKTHVNTMKTEASALVRAIMTQSTADQQRRVTRINRRRAALRRLDALDLDAMLGDAGLRKLLESYCKKELVEENFLFLIEPDHVPNTLRVANTLITKYIETSAPKQINISGPKRKAIIGMYNIVKELGVSDDASVELQLKSEALKEQATVAIKAAKLSVQEAITPWDYWEKSWLNAYKDIHSLTTLDTLPRMRSAPEVVAALE